MDKKWVEPLNKAIVRWEGIVENNGEILKDDQSCALCDVEPQMGCNNCPLFVLEGKACGEYGSVYYEWTKWDVFRPRLNQAKAVLARLVDCLDEEGEDGT